MKKINMNWSTIAWVTAIVIIVGIIAIPNLKSSWHRSEYNDGMMKAIKTASECRNQSEACPEGHATVHEDGFTIVTNRDRDKFTVFVKPLYFSGLFREKRFSFTVTETWLAKKVNGQSVATIIAKNLETGDEEIARFRLR